MESRNKIGVTRTEVVPSTSLSFDQWSCDIFRLLYSNPCVSKLSSPTLI